ARAAKRDRRRPNRRPSSTSVRNQVLPAFVSISDPTRRRPTRSFVGCVLTSGSLALCQEREYRYSTGRSLVGHADRSFGRRARQKKSGALDAPLSDGAGNSCWIIVWGTTRGIPFPRRDACRPGPPRRRRRRRLPEAWPPSGNRG